LFCEKFCKQSANVKELLYSKIAKDVNPAALLSSVHIWSIKVQRKSFGKLLPCTRFSGEKPAKRKFNLLQALDIEDDMENVIWRN
jgi:hypothetical protein